MNFFSFIKMFLFRSCKGIKYQMKVFINMFYSYLVTKFVGFYNVKLMIYEFFGI